MSAAPRQRLPNHWLQLLDVFARPQHVTGGTVFAHLVTPGRGRDQFSIRYALYNVTSSNSRGVGGLSAPSASAALDNNDQTVAFIDKGTQLTAQTHNKAIIQDLVAIAQARDWQHVTVSGTQAFRREAWKAAEACGSSFSA